MNGETFRAGNTMFGPMFMKIGTDSEGTGSYDIQDLVPTGDNIPNGENGAIGTDTISFQKLTAQGGADTTVGILMWRDSKGEEWGKGSRAQTYYGWYKGVSATKPATVSITSGEAAWINVPTGASCSFTVSGQVPSQDVYFPLRKGNTAVCNPMPVVIDLQKVLPYGIDGADVPNGENGTIGTDTISLQKLTAQGGADTTVGILMWRDSKGAEWGKGSRAQTYCGWYKGVSATKPATVSLNPGEGVWINCPNETTAVVFPSVWEKAVE